jgi:hypothetical protein
MQVIQGDEEARRPDGVGCQLEAFPARLEVGPPGRDEPWSWYLKRRARALGERLMRALGVGAQAPRPPAPAPRLPAPRLAPGDRVRVRSAEDIRSTLDEKGALSGCAFGVGMYAYCGKELRVARVVERFFDEARWRMLRARDLVLLGGVHCDGASHPDTRGCDRMCFYFWRTEWLERIDEPGPGADR